MNRNIKPGIFITVEGVDGAGKSTHLQWLAEQLQTKLPDVVITREPGGTPLAEQLRQLLLNTPMSLNTETLLMFAARSEHLDQVVRPALARGAWVLCDRFTDATFAYQGAGRQLGADRIAALQDWTHADLQPDLTFLFDLPPSVAAQRRQLRQGQVSADQTTTADRFEQQSAAFFERVRHAYLARAAAEPNRFVIIDSSLDLPQVAAQVAAAFDAAFMRFSGQKTTESIENRAFLIRDQTPTSISGGFDVSDVRRVPHRSGQ